MVRNTLAVIKQIDVDPINQLVNDHEPNLVFNKAVFIIDVKGTRVSFKGNQIKGRIVSGISEPLVDWIYPALKGKVTSSAELQVLVENHPTSPI